mgnify:CR=1 FL=1
MLLLIPMTGCSRIINKNGVYEEMRFGKSFDIKVDESEIVDAQYLQKILDETGAKNVSHWGMLGSDELQKMINYMGANNLMIVPGTYHLSQSWIFDDGLFETGDGKRHEILKFQIK